MNFWGYLAREVCADFVVGVAYVAGFVFGLLSDGSPVCNRIPLPSLKFIIVLINPLFKVGSPNQIMCGIGTLIGLHNGTENQLKERFDKVSHRGPDISSFEMIDKQVRFYFYRLKIVGTASDTSNQPLHFTGGTTGKTAELSLICNGEIYNYLTLAKKHKFDLKTGSDCEIFFHMYLKFGCSMFQQIDGEFALIMYDHRSKRLITARDHMGIRSFLFGKTDTGYAFSSELAGLSGWTSQIKQHPPGSYMVFQKATEWELVKTSVYYQPEWNRENIPLIRGSTFDATLTGILMTIKRLVIDSVKSRMMGDREIGVFLSGGLDSSIIAAIATQLRPTTKTFAIGLKNSPDLAAARTAAAAIKSDHHEVNFTVMQAITSCSELVRHTASPDTTTNRASMPMYLLSRYIRDKSDVRVMLSGEGPDEVVPGYLYFHRAPSDLALANDSGRLVKELCYYDLLRTDHSVSAHGIEARVPYLSKALIDFFFMLPASFRSPHFPVKAGFSEHPIEKWLLRKAFEGYLPKNILWRPKEAFSDGVGYSWVDGIQKFAKSMVTDGAFEKRNLTYPEMTPATKEAYFWRQLYTQHYPETLTVPRQWNIQWYDHGGDPSARVLPTHKRVICGDS